MDTAKRAVIESIPKIPEPQGVCLIPGSGTLAVASGGDGNVRFYDADLKLLGVIPNLPDADNVRYDQHAKLLYVGYGEGALAVIDPRMICSTTRPANGFTFPAAEARSPCSSRTIRTITTRSHT